MTMIEVRGCNTIDRSHVRQVVEEMKRCGPPRVRVLRRGALLQAIEGTHRLEAARQLQFRVILEVVADESTDDNVVVLDAYGPGKSTTVEQLRATHLAEGHIRESVVLDQSLVTFVERGSTTFSSSTRMPLKNL